MTLGHFSRSNADTVNGSAPAEQLGFSLKAVNLMWFIPIDL